jgi:sulfoacetaldehyde acetyltransferase
MLGLVKKISVGICGDAKARPGAAGAAERAHAGLRREQGRARETIAAEKAAWEKELAELDARADAYSLDMIERRRELEGGGTCTRARCCASSKRRCRDAMVSTDIGNICSVANSYLRFESRAASSRR